jgi:Fe2+ transport system protein FeoA
LRSELQRKDWAPNEGNWTFLGSIDQRLLELGFVPEDPLKKD